MGSKFLDTNCHFKTVAVGIVGGGGDDSISKVLGINHEDLGLISQHSCKTNAGWPMFIISVLELERFFL